jgi:hypothetical protein
MRPATALLVMIGLSVGCDKAKPGLNECEGLEAAGKLTEAMAACNAAHQADPETTSGRAAVTKATEIQAKLDEVVPATVTLDWCYRLAQRLEPKLADEAEAKYGAGAGHDGRLHDYILNLAYNCQKDVGKPRQGLWACRWNETLDYDKECGPYEKKIEKCQEDCRTKWRACRMADGGEAPCEEASKRCELTCDG